VRRRTTIVLALTGAAAVAAAPATAGSQKKSSKKSAKSRTVKVEDNYFQPRKLTVKKGTRITWVWPDGGGDVHDVKLTKGPKGVKKFQSDPGSAGFRYRRTLTKPGKYQILCTFHEEDGMRMTITVKRR
jgi:plastocyanin